MKDLINIGSGKITTEGSCNFCKRGELSTSGRGLNYPYTHITTLSTANGGGVKVNICEDCLTELVLYYGKGSLR